MTGERRGKERTEEKKAFACKFWSLLSIFSV